MSVTKSSSGFHSGPLVIDKIHSDPFSHDKNANDHGVFVAVTHGRRNHKIASNTKLPLKDSSVFTVVWFGHAAVRHPFTADGFPSSQ